MSVWRLQSTPAFEGLGARLRELRRARGLSLDDLAAISGVPPSTISKIENRQMNPSLVHAINMAEALNENLGFLIDDRVGRDVAFTVVRSNTRAKLDLPEMSLSLEDLHGDFAPGILEARLGTITAGATSGEEPMRHAGEELCHVLDGAIRYIVDGQRFDLGVGDTIQFKCSDPHLWENIAPGTTRVLWVFSEGLSF
ncbi:MAG: helix-turn-helix domain-containing protein [Rhizobiaceae bacterium]|nr:helix-turn-helix domain-containing protein [Rhizobiaceae bacterium]|tara:strand:+ start:28397 stop:28987 length:591 start_codon:yes stop_codon:yes gene_type:complete